MKIIPSDCSYVVPGAPVWVINENTKEYSEKGLGEYAAMLSWHNMAPLDKKQASEPRKGGGADQVRGTVQCYLGHCSDMSMGRGNSDADLGTAAPNPCKANELYLPRGEGTFRPMSRLSEVFKAPWADKNRISSDPVQECKHQRFVKSPELCPAQYENVVPAITHARKEMFTMGEDEQEVKTPVLLTNKFWVDAVEEANLGTPSLDSVMDDSDYRALLLRHLQDPADMPLGEFVKSLVDDMMAGKWEMIPYQQLPLARKWKSLKDFFPALKSHFDTMNCSDAPMALTAASLVMYQSHIYRTIFVAYDRQSTTDWAEKFLANKGILGKAASHYQALPAPLKDRGLKDYKDVIGNKGAILLVDANTNRLVSLGLKTDPALSKSATFLSAFSYPTMRLAKKEGLGLLQINALQRLVASLSATFMLGTILMQWGDKPGAIGPNPIVTYEEDAKRIFGGHSMGPCHRFSPSHNSEWKREQVANDLHQLDFIHSYVADRTSRMTPSRRALSNTQKQEFVEDISKLIQKVPGVGGLTAQHALAYAVSVGHYPAPWMLHHSAFSAASAAYKNKKCTAAQMRDLLLSTASHCNVSTSEGEWLLCEPNRGRDVCDVFLANTCLIGNPTLVEGDGPGDHAMQMMRVDTGEWMPLPPITPTSQGSCGEAIAAVIESGAHMPESVAVGHSKEVKAEAKSRYWHVQIPSSEVDGPSGKHTVAEWRAIVDGAIAWNPQETYEETMTRLQPAVEQYLGVCLANKAGVVKAATAIAREKKKRAKGNSRAGAATSGGGNASDELPRTGPTSSRTTALLADTQTQLITSVFSTSSEYFGGTKPTSVKTLPQLLAKGGSWATLEPYGSLSNVLKETGVLAKQRKNLTAKDFEVLKVYKEKGRGQESFGFCATLRVADLNLDYTNAITTPLASQVSVQVFGGKRMLDRDTKVERIVFPDKKTAIRALLVIGILTKARANPNSAASIVEKLMRQGGVQSPWMVNEAKSVGVLVQGCKEPVGHVVTEGKKAWFAFEGPSDDNSRKQGKLLFYEFATKQTLSSVKSTCVPPKNPKKRCHPTSAHDATPGQTEEQEESERLAVDSAESCAESSSKRKRKRRKKQKRATTNLD